MISVILNLMLYNKAWKIKNSLIFLRRIRESERKYYFVNTQYATTVS